MNFLSRQYLAQPKNLLLANKEPGVWNEFSFQEIPLFFGDNDVIDNKVLNLLKMKWIYWWNQHKRWSIMEGSKIFDTCFFYRWKVLLEIKTNSRASTQHYDRRKFTVVWWNENIYQVKLKCSWNKSKSQNCRVFKQNNWK